MANSGEKYIISSGGGKQSTSQGARGSGGNSRLSQRHSETPWMASEKQPLHRIDRFGLHDLAGTLVRDGPDPVTVQILEEVHNLPKKAMGFDVDENALKSQESKPPQHMPGSHSRVGVETLGLNSLKFSPLKLVRVYGRTPSLPVLNFTGLHKSHVAYAASNVLVFFDYYNNVQSVLQGHKNKIKCLCVDKYYRFIATGDVGLGSAVIVWNVHNGFPFRNLSITDGKDNAGATSVAFMCSDGFFLAVISLEQIQVPETKQEDGIEVTKKIDVDRQFVSIWYFGDPSHRKNKRKAVEAKMEIPRRAGQQRDILFSEDVPYHFITTGDNRVVFYTWLRKEKKILAHTPKGHMKMLQRLKGFTVSIWVKDSVLTATRTGTIIEWKSQAPLGLEPIPDPSHNVKEFRRCIKIDEYSALTDICLHQDHFVVGDDAGTVRFFDNRFRLLRWTKSPIAQPITGLAFNLTDKQPEWKFEIRNTYAEFNYDHNTAHRLGKSAVYDYTYGGVKYRPPTEATLERGPLHPPEGCLDLVVSYIDGTVAYFHIAEDKVDRILRGTPGNIAAMDANPVTPHVALSTEMGEVQMYDYEKQEILYSGKVFKKKALVTCMRFHPTGSFLVLGTDKGTIYFRRTYTWGLLDNPLHTGHFPIVRIEFSSDGLYMGMFDSDMVVTLCNHKARSQSWNVKGKHKSHYRPIVDIAFFHDSVSGSQRFFSLGEDRRIIEYDIPLSTATSGLRILHVIFLEQTHVPTSMVVDASFPDHGPIINYANTNNKVRMYDPDACKIRKTCQGPAFGSPINRMIVTTPELSSGRNSKFILMVLGKKIGLMKTPIDGNPFKNMAVLGHATEIRDIGVGRNGQEVFTTAINDNCMFMWNPDIMALENSVLTGGSGITPFKHYIDSNLPPGHSMVEDIENIFYHLMMKRAKSQNELLNMNLTILISEIPTVMRICGHFPTELEIDMMFEEVEFLLGLKYGEKPIEINYEDFLVLYANHKDEGIHKKDVIRAFEVLGEYNLADELCIPREEFVTLITTKGEKLSELDLPLFLPSFYQSKLKLDVPKKKPEPWAIKISNMSLSMVPGLSAYDKSDVSVKIPSRQSLESQVSSTQHFQHHRIDKKPSTITTTADSQMLPEDEDEPWIPIREMPDDITANFFIQQLLHKDMYDTLNLGGSDQTGDLEDLERIHENHQGRKAFQEILNRWKGRDEWRYFQRIFEILKHDNIPMNIKIEAVIEMDYYIRTGNWPKSGVKGLQMELAKEDEDEEDYGDLDDDSETDLPAGDRGSKTRGKSSDQESIGKKSSQGNRGDEAGAETDWLEHFGEGGIITESKFDMSLLMEDYIEDTTATAEDEDEHEYDVVDEEVLEGYFASTSGQEGETEEDSETTQGNRLSRPFTNVPKTPVEAEEIPKDDP